MYQIDIAFRAAATISLSVLASAQSPLFDIVGEAAGNRFAYSVAGVGDVDGSLRSARFDMNYFLLQRHVPSRDN